MPYELQSIRSVPEGLRSDGRSVSGPDVDVTCTVGGQDIRIGIELTEYQVDATNRGSKGRRWEAFYWRIQRHLEPLLRSSNSLQHCHGSLDFDWGSTPQPNEAKKVAEELYRFAETHIDELADDVHYGYFRDSRRGRPKTNRLVYDSFRGFPLLGKYFKKIGLIRHPNHTGHLWSWNAATGVGIVEDNVVKLIEAKTNKVDKYDTAGTDQTWLVICAGVSIPHDSAGPDHPGNLVHFKSPEIREAAAAAKRAGFDRVVFWERTHGWHRDLV